MLLPWFRELSTVAWRSEGTSPMAPRAARAARKILGRAMPMVQLMEHRPQREQRPKTASTQALAIARSKGLAPTSLGARRPMVVKLRLNTEEISSSLWAGMFSRVASMRW